MEKLVLKKVVTLGAALILGSACIANDALARGGGGFGGLGGGNGGVLGDNGGGVHHFVGSVRDDAFHLTKSGFQSLGTHGYNCWKSQGIPTNPAWRQRHAEDGTCY